MGMIALHHTPKQPRLTKHRSLSTPNDEPFTRNYRRGPEPGDHFSFNDSASSSRRIVGFIDDLPLFGYGLDRGDGVERALGQLDAAFPRGYQH